MIDIKDEEGKEKERSVYVGKNVDTYCSGTLPNGKERKGLPGRLVEDKSTEPYISPSLGSLFFDCNSLDENKRGLAEPNSDIRKLKSLFLTAKDNIDYVWHLSKNDTRMTHHYIQATVDVVLAKGCLRWTLNSADDGGQDRHRRCDAYSLHFLPYKAMNLFPDRVLGKCRVLPEPVARSLAHRPCMRYNRYMQSLIVYFLALLEKARKMRKVEGRERGVVRGVKETLRKRACGKKEIVEIGKRVNNDIDEITIRFSGEV
ncbi:hypothetical protein EVAR_82071_1 [Eumeta japonica]|uniref:Uncharacterized protein n=1 Tax=Eumeta variegata TaxID=151549 RepID=A0A4C1U1S9_EUMVA|nr:hypothetical protein EVAR_82071_1 [Eumeta japonica]